MLSLPVILQHQSLRRAGSLEVKAHLLRRSPLQLALLRLRLALRQVLPGLVQVFSGVPSPRRRLGTRARRKKARLQSLPEPALVRLVHPLLDLPRKSQG